VSALGILTERHAPEGAHIRRVPRLTFINGLAGFVTLEKSDILQATALHIEDGRLVAIYLTRNPDKVRLR
jgi:RNA polymerase sigma-70 factor (ECF subfamily)